MGAVPGVLACTLPLATLDRSDRASCALSSVISMATMRIENIRPLLLDQVNWGYIQLQKDSAYLWNAEDHGECADNEGPTF